MKYALATLYKHYQKTGRIKVGTFAVEVLKNDSIEALVRLANGQMITMPSKDLEVVSRARYEQLMGRMISAPNDWSNTTLLFGNPNAAKQHKSTV